MAASPASPLPLGVTSQAPCWTILPSPSQGYRPRGRPRSPVFSSVVQAQASACPLSPVKKERIPGIGLLSPPSLPTCSPRERQAPAGPYQVIESHSLHCLPLHRQETSAQRLRQLPKMSYPSQWEKFTLDYLRNVTGQRQCCWASRRSKFSTLQLFFGTSAPNSKHLSH